MSTCAWSLKGPLEPLSAQFPEVRSLSLVASSPQYSLAPAPESPPVTRLPLGREYARKPVSSTSCGSFHLVLEKCTELSCYNGGHSLLHFSVTCLFSPRSPFPCTCGNQAEKKECCLSRQPTAGETAKLPLLSICAGKPPIFCTTPCPTSSNHTAVSQ